jgi:hypothetical protein
MKNVKKFASRQLLARAAVVFLAAGGVTATQAQTTAPTPAPAPATAQPEAADHGSMGQGGMGGIGVTDHSAMDGMSGMSHAGGGMMKQMMCGFTEHLDARLAYLRTELKITDQQTPQWNAFADAWRTIAQKASAKCAAAEGHQIDGKQSVLGQLSMIETHMVDHLEVLRAQKAALEPLFNVLTDDQKKAANQTLRQLMKVGMPMGGGGMSDMDGMQHSSRGVDSKDNIQHGGGGMGGMGGMRHGGGMGGMQH